MILIGTDEGIYRWTEGAGWPVFHALQGRAIVGLASPGVASVVAVDRSGDVLESVDTGMTWRALPLPEGSGRPTALAHNSAGGLAVALKPLGLYRRGVGAPTPRARVVGTSPRQRIVERARGLAVNATALVAPGRVRPEPSAEAVRLAGWTRLNTPNVSKTTVDSDVRLLVGTPDGLFAAIDGSGLWKSTDAGANWSPCPGLPSEVYALRAVPGRAGCLWVATSDGAYLSSDGGTSWQDLSTGLENARQVRSIEVKPGSPDVLLAGAAPRPTSTTGAASRQGLNFSLYESINGGKAWTHVKKNFPEVLESDVITDIRCDPAEPDLALVSLGSGELWATRNGGAYWGPLARQIRAARVLCPIG